MIKYDNFTFNTLEDLEKYLCENINDVDKIQDILGKYADYNKYQEAFDGISDLAKQYDFDSVSGSNYPRYYFDGDVVATNSLFDDDINLLQEAVNKAKEYDNLTQQLGCPIDVYIKLTQSMAEDIVTDIPEELLEKVRKNSCLTITQDELEFDKKHFLINIVAKYPDYDIETCRWVKLEYKDYGKTWRFKEDLD